MKEFVDHDIASRKVSAIEKSFIELDVEIRVTNGGVCSSQPLFFLFGCEADGIENASVLSRSKDAQEVIAVGSRIFPNSAKIILRK